MACATGMLHFGNTIGIFIAARVFQGVAAAILYSAGLALLYDSVGKENLGQAMGYITLSITAGAFLGPSLGGILYDVGQETAVFGLAYGVLLVDIILRFSVVEKDSAKDARPAATSGYGTMSTRPADSAEASEPISRAVSKMSTFRLLQSPRLLTALFGWFVVGTLLSAFDGVLPIFVQNTFGWSSAGAGLIFLPLFIPNLGGPLYGRMVDSSRHGGRIVATTGFLLCIPFFVLLRLVAYQSARTQVLLGVLLFLIGLGLALCGPPLFVEVAKTVSSIEEESPGAFGDKGAMAQAYALYNCAFAVGQLVGPMWAWAVKSTLGWATLTWMFGLASGLTGIITGLFLGGWIGSALRSPKPPGENEHWPVPS
ncbi:hypothetical protein MMC07_001604 [Pseudocyphellaria aurata]|nr:hypothetical protein [Pseudocyphellaria aurata]